MKKQSKLTFLKTFNHNLRELIPEDDNTFMCPTCLCRINFAKFELISDAHIIPKYAGGNIITFLCKKCNTEFGGKQDKWFGDFLKSVSSRNKFLSTTTSKGYFEIDKTKVNGHIEQDSDGNINLFMNPKLNSPSRMAELLNKFSNHPSELKFSMPLPILENDNLIKIGFLTAGYLMWFRTFGYSWVLQSHLDIVRKQILNPNDEIISINQFLFICKNVTWEPWIGIIKLMNMHLPCFGLKDHLIIYPSKTHKNAYEKITSFNGKVNGNDIRKIELNNELIYKQPTALLFENEFIIATDHLRKLRTTFLGILISDMFDGFKILKATKSAQKDECDRETIVFHARF